MSCRVAVFLLVCWLTSALTAGEPPTLVLDRPMPPPGWALLERELLKANTEACKEFFARYFDERGYLRCVERWGGDDGPDDAIENLNDWPILHALGAGDCINDMVKKAWEGHLRQYTAARTAQVPFARDGMYFKEFPVMMDWLHNGEGLTVFNLMGLSDPYDDRFQQRVRRYAGFYMNEDAGAPNYDPKYKLIRSMFNGSRGPLLRKATALDWAGDPIEVEGRFQPGHGERNYQEMLDHFKDYNDIVGDHPQNLLTTSLALNAYMLSGEEKYKSWLLEYVDAWRQRMSANGGIIPTNIGLDGKIGGSCGGKWYGGVYGWGFSVVVPQTRELAHRNLHHLGFIGLQNAFLLTGDDAYLAPWRRQSDLVNAQRKTVDGKAMYPRMHGDQGWYHYSPQPYAAFAPEIYYLSMKPHDRQRSADWLPPNTQKNDITYFDRFPNKGWFTYLDGKHLTYPEETLRRDFARIRRRVAAMRRDTTTDDTRLSDDPMKFNPASVAGLIELMLGGLHPGHRGSVLLCRLRYFDPVNRRAGMPDGVAALVEKLNDTQTTVILVNTNQVAARTVVVQAGGYAEHQFVQATVGNHTTALNGPYFTVRLEPGCGSRLLLQMKRHVHKPTLAFPWDRGWMLKEFAGS